ncbi:MAG: histidine kinase [Dorea sp.]|nr:histidine kinase [Dorea sp.]
MKADKLKLAYKLTFCYLLYHILLVTAILFFVDRGIVLLENRFEEKYRENAEVSMEALNQRLLQLKDTLTLAMYGENIQVLRGRKGSLTTYEEVNLKLKVKSELSVLANQYGYIKDLGIYLPEYETWIDVGTWFENQSVPGRKLFGDVLEVRSGEICLRLGMQNEKKYMEGYACLNSSELQKLLDQKIADNMRMQVTIDGQELSELGNAQDYYPITVRSELYPIEVTYYIPPEIMSLRKYLYVLGGISILFLAITAAAFSRYLNKAIHRPLNNIVRFMEQAKEEKGGEPAVHQGLEEFNYVTAEFNKMKEYLEYYTRRRYEQEIIMKQMELDHLQEQIKPHFLYNCFANISNLCKSYDVEKVEKLSHALSKYYSYVTRTGKEMVSLREEYEHMKNYLIIQKIRFEGRVSIEVQELPQAGDTVEVPRLILQPIVENAYKYVFEHVEKEGKLVICAEENDTAVTITIEDSGYQMGEDVLCRIQDALKKEDVHITGLGNLQKRLQFVDSENKIHAGHSSLGGVKMVLTVRKRGRENGHA